MTYTNLMTQNTFGYAKLEEWVLVVHFDAILFCRVNLTT